VKRILFIGASIIDCGRDRDDFYSLGDGFVKKLVNKYLQGYEVLNRGIGGNTVQDLKARWEEDCIALKPDIVCVHIGINNAWRESDGILKEDNEKFDADYRWMMERVKSQLPNTKIIILEPCVFKVGAGTQLFRDSLNKKIDIIRDIANDYAFVFIPLDGIFHSFRVQRRDEELLDDGVHPTDLGHEIIACEVSKRLLNDGN